MKILLVNNVEDTSIDSETIFENLKKALSQKHEVKLVNYKMAAKAVNKPIVEEYYRYSINDRNIIMAEYINQYENLFGLDLVIAADCSFNIGNINKPVISYLKSPFKDIAEIANDRGYYNLDELLEFGRYYPHIQKEQVKSSNEIVVTDDYMIDYVGKLGCSDPLVIHPSIDTDRFKPNTSVENDKLKDKYNIPKDKKVGIWCGFFHGLYGYHFVQELAKEMTDIFWIFVIRPRINNKTKLDNVKLMEYNPENMHELYNCADFLINPAYLSSIDLRSIEAMACDIPIINSKTGMFFNWSSGECGEIVTKQKTEAYKEAVQKVINGTIEYKPREVLILEGFDFKTFSEKWLITVDKYK